MLCGQAGAPAALAAEPGEEDAVTALGLGLGGFTAFPSLGIGGVFTDNVARSSVARRADLGWRLAPELEIDSDWVRHDASLRFSSEHLFFAKEPEQNSNAVAAGGKFRLDIRRTTFAELAAHFDLTEEDRTSIDVPTNAVGRRRNLAYGTSTGLTHQANRLAATLHSGIDRFTYGEDMLADGTVVSNKDLDYLEPFVSLRLGYEVSPAVKPFASARYGPRFHEIEVDRSGLRRDSDGFAFAAGAAFDWSPVWSGEAALTYDLRDYQDAALETIRGFGVEANLTWNPSRLTRITLEAATGIEETSVASASASRVHDLDLKASHALRWNLIVNGALGYSIEAFDGGGTDHTWTAALGLSYLLSREVALVGGYSYLDLRSDSPGRDYVENRLQVGVTLRK